VLNSAVVTDFGSYSYEPLTIDAVRAWLHAGPVISQVGYQSTADWIESRLGIRLPLSRDARRMQPGDEALVVRLRYRLDDPARKAGGGVALTDEDVEIGLLRRIS
ncbi:MAG: YddF family protein, partial [Candidatus Bipolaricaulota bacterium]|nr:YddF family protein [Candidatus Bipolaricaulota bacterium]